MPWYEHWFDTSLYEKIYASRDDEDAEDLLTMVLPHIQNCDHLADLGCGRGRHSINLALRGFKIDGYDLSPRAIRKASEKASSLHLKNAQFFVHDMLKPLGKSYDGLVNFFTSFGYFEQEAQHHQVIANMVAAVSGSGIIIIDFLNPEKVKQSLKPEDEGSWEDGYYKIKRYEKDGFVQKDLMITDTTSNVEHTFHEQVALLPKDWFENAFDQHAYSIKTCYGDYFGNEYDRNNSPRMIMIASPIKP